MDLSQMFSKASESAVKNKSVIYQILRMIRAKTFLWVVPTLKASAKNSKTQQRFGLRDKGLQNILLRLAQTRPKH